MGLEMNWQQASYRADKKVKLGDAVAKTGSAIGDAIQNIGMKKIELKKAEMDHTADVYKRAMEHQYDMEFLHQLPEHARSFTRVHGVSTTVDLGQGKPRTTSRPAARKPAAKKPAAKPVADAIAAAVKKPTVAAVNRQNKAAASYVTPYAGKKLDPAVKAQNAAARSYVTSTPATKPAAKPKQALKTNTKDKKDD